MLRLLVGRLLSTIPVIAVVAIMVFLFVRLGPGDPAAILAGDNASSETIAQIRQQLGLDQPIWSQFLIWIGGVARGELGTSIMAKQPVLTLIAQRIEPTVSLAIVTMLLSILVAVPLGAIAAYRRGTLIDRAVVAIMTLGLSLPIFVSGYILMQIGAIQLRVFPVQGFRSISDGLGSFLSYILLPSLSLSGLFISLIARMTRSSMLEVMGEDHVRTARAKGLSETRVLIHHVLRNAGLPIITVIAAGLGLLLAGVVVTESVFNIPGIGRLTVEAILARDYPVVQGVILCSSIVFILINLIVDILYRLIDHRVKS